MASVADGVVANQARDDIEALTAKVLYGVGPVGLGAHAVLWMTAPDDAVALRTASITPDRGVLTWSGSFSLHSPS